MNKNTLNYMKLKRDLDHKVRKVKGLAAKEIRRMRHSAGIHGNSKIQIRIQVKILRRNIFITLIMHRNQSLDNTMYLKESFSFMFLTKNSLHMPLNCILMLMRSKISMQMKLWHLY